MPAPTTERAWTLRRALVEGWTAAKANARAMAFIQAVAAGVVVAYYAWPDFEHATRAIGPWRDRMGLPGSFVVGFIAGGLVPELAKLATRQVQRLDREALSRLGFVGLVYGVLGIQIDLFYRLQSVWFGHGVDVGTIARKLAVDMGLAAPLIFIPYSVGMFLWRERGFRLGALRELFTWQVYRARILTIQVMNWFVWIPVLCAIYALPLPLQFPLSSLIEACWSLLLVVMAAPKEEG